MSEPQEIKIAGYCRTCGIGLDQANLRISNGVIYCAEHVPPDPSTGTSASPADSPYTSARQPYHVGEGSPGAAFLLGMIPGVGAIYNGQYIKGIVHILILGMLISAVDRGGGPAFGMLIPGFWFYMAFEAYHTAKRRHEGLPVDEFSSLGMGTVHASFPIAPILLILFGIVFLLDNLNLIDLDRLLRYWPVGMIGLGVYMLYLRTKGSDHE
jgi:hypothetical protein